MYVSMYRPTIIYLIVLAGAEHENVCIIGAQFEFVSACVHGQLLEET
jgi:hypothetical protein